MSREYAAAPREYEIAIVGGGPAGLSAALVLGRCCRRVLLCDSDLPRNARSRRVRGFLTRDGVTPTALRRTAREQLTRYKTVQLRDIAVTAVEGTDGAFMLLLADGTSARARKLLLATGVVDQLPPVRGLSRLWGRGVFPCPYCDGFEYRGGALGVLGNGQRAFELCRALTGWSSDITLFADGPTGLSAGDEHKLCENRVRIVRARIEAVIGSRRLERVRTEHDEMKCDALFVVAPQRQRSALVEMIGCAVNSEGCVEVVEHESTNVPGE